MNEINKHQLDHLLNDWLDLPSRKFRLVTDHVGQGMNGKASWGIEAGCLADMFEFFVALGIVFDVDEARELSLAARWDEVVGGVIVYFPYWKLVD
jgi:hypothetical protein